MHNYLKDFLHIIYPEVCVGCGNDTLASGHLLCAACYHQLPATNFFEQKENPVMEKFFGRAKISNAGSAYFYDKKSVIQRMLHELKYKQNKECGRYLGTLLANEIVSSDWMCNVDVIIPVPLSKKRKFQRGYNQSVLIAEPLAEKFGLTINDEAVVRTVNTETQTHKNREERWNSMQNIFKIEDISAIKNKHILVLDDVLTTGATIEVLCNVLLQESGAKVSIATFACAI